jgi:2,4-dienoyl-CoA reductase-like NADH-dependent reductase (Old Yellow Enzyme family)
MYEHMAAFFGGPPNAHHFSLYARWAKYGWGMIITGNIQVSRSHLTLGRDMVIPGIVTEESVRPYIDLVAAIHGASPSMGDTDTSASPKNLQDSRALAIAQLSHAGRQSPNFLGGRAPFVPPLAPSAVRLGSDRSSNVVTWLLNRVLFQTSRSMDLNDIEDVVSSFIRGAKVATAAGFDGVQLHVAHGCESLALFYFPGVLFVG